MDYASQAERIFIRKVLRSVGWKEAKWMMWIYWTTRGIDIYGDYLSIREPSFLLNDSVTGLPSRPPENLNECQFAMVSFVGKPSPS